MTGVAERSDASVPSDPNAESGAESGADPNASRGAGSPGPRWFVLVPVFVVLAVALTFPSLGKLDTHLVGNSGDAILILWILGWAQHAIPQGWDALWNTSMYHPADNTLAYSESMLSMALAQWPLRLFFGPELSLNVLAIATQTAALYFSYRVALLLTRSWPASFVAALMFGFSQPIMSHLGHTQLTLSAFLVPLTLYLLARYLQTFRVRYGVGLGLALAALTTSATYYALMMGVAVAVVLVGYLLWFRPRRAWVVVRGLLAGAALALAITLPVAAQYTLLQDDPHFRRAFDPNTSAHFGDFLSVDGASYLVDELPVLDEESAKRGVENHLYPGLFTVAFAGVGAVVVVRGLRRQGDTAVEALDGARSPAGNVQWTSRMALLIAAAGVAGLVLAFGDEVQVLGMTLPMPMKVFRKVVPGFSGIRVTSRFVLIAQFALAVFAAFGVRALLARLSQRVAVVAMVALSLVLLAESARSVPYVDVPDDRVAEAVGRYLEDRPRGVVAELPIRGTIDGPVWSYTESPRLLVSLIDANDRVNGYSGYTPPGFDAIVGPINTFPSEESLRLLDERDVRYVVLRTKVIGDQFPVFDELLGQDGVGRFLPATARARIDAIPPERVKSVTEVPGAFVVELRKP